MPKNNYRNYNYRNNTHRHRPPVAVNQPKRRPTCFFNNNLAFVWTRRVHLIHHCPIRHGCFRTGIRSETSLPQRKRRIRIITKGTIRSDPGIHPAGAHNPPIVGPVRAIDFPGSSWYDSPVPQPWATGGSLPAKTPPPAACRREIESFFRPCHSWHRRVYRMQLAARSLSKTSEFWREPFSHSLLPARALLRSTCRDVSESLPSAIRRRSSIAPTPCFPIERDRNRTKQADQAG